MTALEEIEAAIEKLTKLRDGAFNGPWTALGTGVANGDHWHVIAESSSIASISANDGDDEELREPTAVLIVTLHRALPEIIWLLTSIAIRLVSGSTGPLEVDHALLLARAINGGTE